jgi:hypothetical protein
MNRSTLSQLHSNAPNLTPPHYTLLPPTSGSVTPTVPSRPADQLLPYSRHSHHHSASLTCKCVGHYCCTLLHTANYPAYQPLLLYKYHNLPPSPASVLATTALHAAATPAGPASASTNGTAMLAASEPTADPHSSARSRVWRCLKRSLQTGSRQVWW